MRVDGAKSRDKRNDQDMDDSGVVGGYHQVDSLAWGDREDGGVLRSLQLTPHRTGISLPMGISQDIVVLTTSATPTLTKRTPPSSSSSTNKDRRRRHHRFRGLRGGRGPSTPRRHHTVPGAKSSLLPRQRARGTWEEQHARERARRVSDPQPVGTRASRSFAMKALGSGSMRGWRVVSGLPGHHLV